MRSTPASCIFTPQAQPLEGVKLTEMHKEMVIWHQAHLEYGCGADLEDVSLSTWNQDEVYGGFSGAHAVVKCGVGKVVDYLAAGLDIQCGQVIEEVEYDENGVHVRTAKGVQFSAGNRYLPSFGLPLAKRGLFLLFLQGTITLLGWSS